MFPMRLQSWSFFFVLFLPPEHPIWNLKREAKFKVQSSVTRDETEGIREGGGLLEVDDRSQRGGRDWSRSQGGLDDLAPAGRYLANEGRNKVGTRGFEQVRRGAALRRGREDGDRGPILEVSKDFFILGWVERRADFCMNSLTRSPVPTRSLAAMNTEC